MSLRREFVLLAMQPEANVAQLCRRFQISRKTGYKFLARYEAQGEAGLVDRSQRPEHSPARTAARLEQAIVRLRERHPAWGARKLITRLRALGYKDLPAPSTAQAILARNGLIAPEQSAKHQPFRRFEREEPNALWQMDFKGHFALGDARRCHALTVLDDHSRFDLALRACADEQTPTVRNALTELFRRYGLPQSMGMDNGAPWGDRYEQPYTPLTVWLIRLGISVWHSRPYHPQTLGKDERFHRTLKAEVLAHRTFADLKRAQHAFDAWREVYNCERPHEALGGHTPLSRYRPSARAFPESPPLIDYPADAHVRKVDLTGKVSFKGSTVRVGKAFHGHPVALRPTAEDGVWAIYFCHQQVKTIDLHQPESLT